MLPRSTMISSNQGVLINGGQFSQYHYHGEASPGSKAPFDILMEAVAPSALHDSGASFDKPKCHPRTRVKILEDIMRWILGDGSDPRAGKQFMWLNGAAGCGKSAIAQSTVELCIQRGLPLASFFFSKSDSTRNHAGSLVATLAYQLYGAFPDTDVQTEILSAIKKDPLIFKKTLQQQFTSLIVQPLMTHFSKDESTQHCVPFLIVIDGLDECTDRTEQKAILTGLAESVRNSNLCIPIFVASRPEHDIKLLFGSKYLKDFHTHLSLDLRDDEYDADSDIQLYLFDRFAQIKDDFNNRTTGRELDQGWPGDTVIETLVRKSLRQFIYAATVIRYVESTRHRPDHRLDVVLNIRPVNGDHPFAELDALYATILESALETEKVLHVLSLHFMLYGSDICCSIIEKLLSYDEGEVEAIFSDMGALVQISKDRHAFSHDEDSPSFLVVLHASLRDFLFDVARSKEFHIDRANETLKHVTHVLQYLSSCCSSSFDPNSSAGTPMYILRYIIHYEIIFRSGDLTIPPELRQSVLSFPLKEFLEPHTSTHAYPHLLEHFVTLFLKLLEAMVLDDPTLSHMQDHQLGILQSFLEPQIQQYFNNDRLASVLVLFYHVGSHHFVPILKPTHAYYMYSTPFYLMSLDFNEGDILSLNHIWEDWGFTITDNSNIYHRYVRQLLRDAGRITNALGPVMHERVALACFKELAITAPLVPSSSGQNITIATGADDAEDDANPKLKFDSAHGVQWQFECSGELKPDNEELYFLLLGYLIFLLPRCGKSDTLVAACEEYRTSYIDQPDGPFPVRRKLLRVEMNKYIAQAPLRDHQTPLRNHRDTGCCFVM
ncbi:hypothetical protein D9613_006358 [Agrocybe pediades]|uniref:Nephrocystin 3-like N-terminal domain-containing protein n=1 Tax=Agrocybe pediades TaxID=84607 RepID=A0A8H4QV39_9AGAR|nr:hypothetical protein D9613_006358 [Agrocybe pediades]